MLQRETGLEEVAETGVMIHGDVSADLLRTIFTPKSPLHDGAVIIRDERIVAAGALLPLAETSIHTERFGTRHRAALGITEQTDAVVVVVSEENGQISLVERARIVRNLTEAGLARAIQGLLDPAGGRRRRRSAGGRRTRRRSSEGRSPRLRELGRFVGRPAAPRAPQATVAPAAVPMPRPRPRPAAAGPRTATAAGRRHPESRPRPRPRPCRTPRRSPTAAGSTQPPAAPTTSDDRVAPRPHGPRGEADPAPDLQ